MSVGLVVALQPSGGLAPVLIMVTATVLIGACAAILIVLLQSQSVQIPVRAAVRRTPAPQRLWNADAPGRPRSRAPGEGCFRDLN
jgi:hypothetical protein